MNAKKFFVCVACGVIGLLLVAAIFIQFPGAAIVNAQSVDTPLNPDTPSIVPNTDAVPVGTITDDDAELIETLLAFTRIREQGPEAVLAFVEGLHGDVLDILEEETDAAREELRAQNPAFPPSQGPPITPASEALANLAEIKAAAVSRQRALGQHDDPRELQFIQQDATDPESIESPSDTEALARFVGPTCPYSTISAAISAANSGDVLYVAGGLTFSGGFTIDKNLTIYGGYDGCGGSDTLTTIDGGGTTRGMTINPGVDVYLHEFNIINGAATGNSGGGILFAAGTSGGTLTLNYVTIQGCTASYGAGIWAGPNSEILGTYVNIYNNDAFYNGGGLRLMGGSATFTSTNIYLNSAESGAGVYGSASTFPSVYLDLASSADVFSNDATAGIATGGGIYFEEGVINIAYGSDVYGNEAYYGGGMYVLTSTVTLANSDVELQNNTASYDGGGLWALDSTINLNNGAEIYDNTTAENGGGAYLDNSDLNTSQGSIIGNTATNSYGGGVYMTNNAVLDMDASSFGCTGSRCTQLSNNTCGKNGGGVYATTGTTVDLREIWIEGNQAYYGGGVYVSYGTLYLNNALLARNYNTWTGTTSPAADGLRIIHTTMAGSHNTFAYNDLNGAATGGAIGSDSSTMTLSNSIIWGHSTSIDGANSSNSVTCSDIQGGYTGTDNRNENPLFVNTGTYDYHLQTISPVIDRCASGESIDFDQDARPIYDVRPGTPYDMGADETGEGRVGLNDNGCLYTNIQAAVSDASPGDTVQVSVGTFTENVDIDKDLTVRGGYSASDCKTTGAGATIIDGDAIESVIDVTSGVVTLQDLELTDGAGMGAGLDTSSDVDVTLQDVAVHHNTGTIGAGVYISPGSVVTATGNSDISYNTATQVGGGIYVEGRFRGEDTDADIMYNSALHGGGIYALSGEIDLWGSDVYQNDATSVTGMGGGVYAGDGSTVELGNSTFIYFLNTAYDGAGLYADNSTVIAAEMHPPYFRQNIAINDGGAVYLNNNSSLTGLVNIGQLVNGQQNQAKNGAGIFSVHSTVNIEGTISNNIAADKGGGMYAENSTVILTDVNVGGLTDKETNILTGADVQGAGLYLTANTRATLLRTDIISNTAPNSPDFVKGLGVMLAGGSVLTMTDSSIQYHDAFGALDASGAGLYVDASTATLSNCGVLSNTTSHDGAGIYLYDTGTLNVNASQMENNDAGVNGGGLAVRSGTPDINIVDTSFKNNEAMAYGGAIYMEAGSLDITGDWDIRQNDAGMNGGALAVFDGSGVLIQADAYSVVYANTATGVGGFLYSLANTDIEVRATDSPSMYIYANSAGGGGGAFAMDAGTLNLYGQLNFDHNTSSGSGGAVYLSNDAELHHYLVNGIGQTYWDNQAEIGGAIYADTVAVIQCNGTTFGNQSTYNQALNGSGGSIYIAGATLDATNTVFNLGMATEHGGAIAAFNATVDIDADFSTCDPLTTDCSLFSENVADSDSNDTGSGGAIYALDSVVDIDHSHFYRNEAYRGGAFFQSGASADGMIRNTLIVSNTISSSGSAGVQSENGLMLIRNTTLADNIGGAGYSQANTTATINQSIAWNNDGMGFWIGSGTASGSCNIDQNAHVGDSDDPLFVDPTSGDYHLQSVSPAADACTSGLLVDLDGNSRPIGFGYDMGAYERTWDYANLLPMVLKDS